MTALSPTYMFDLDVELKLFLEAALLGAALGVLFDVFRAVRAIIPHSAAAVFVEDTLFMLICGFWFFVFSMTEVRGQLRAFLLIAAVLGFFLYLLTVGALIIRVIRRISSAVRRAVLMAADAVKRALAPYFRKITGRFPRRRKKIKKSAKKVLKV